MKNVSLSTHRLPSWTKHSGRSSNGSIRKIGGSIGKPVIAQAGRESKVLLGEKYLRMTLQFLTRLASCCVASQAEEAARARTRSCLLPRPGIPTGDALSEPTYDLDESDHSPTLHQLVVSWPIRAPYSAYGRSYPSGPPAPWVVTAESSSSIAGPHALQNNHGKSLARSLSLHLCCLPIKHIDYSSHNNTDHREPNHVFREHDSSQRLARPCVRSH